jgi:uncharacterized protein (TIGR03000 family)
MMQYLRLATRVLAGLFLLLLPAGSEAQQPSYPYNIQINQGQWPYYTSPYLHRTYQEGRWVYQYYPPTSNEAPGSPVAPAPRAQAAPAEQRAVLNIFVPSADATVWIEGRKTAQQGTKRRFASPPLAAGSSYLYEVRVEWMEGGKKVDRTEEVPVKAGRESSLHFFGAAGPK